MLEVQRGYEPNREREKSITSVVYDQLTSAWGEKKWDEVEFDDLEVMLRTVFKQVVAELGVANHSFKVVEVYKTEIISAMIDQMPLLFDGVDETNISDVCESFANAVPESRKDIFRKALRTLKPTDGNKWERFKSARLLVDQDIQEFKDLGQFGFTQKEQVDLARRIAAKQGVDIFTFAETAGVATDEFVETVFLNLPSQVPIYARHKKLSPDALAELLKGIHLTVRESTRSAFQVPPRTFGMERKVIGTFENPYEKEFPVDVRALQETEQQLNNVLMEAYPHKSKEYQQKAERARALHGKIESVAELNSETSAAPLYLYFSDTDLPAIYKPQKRDLKGIRKGIPAGTYAQREWLAYQIDQALQIETIPVTVLRYGPQGVGSVQEWKVGQGIITMSDLTRLSANTDQLEDITFDAVVKQNTDGHLGNLLIGYDGSVVGIDHGLILSDDPNDHGIRSSVGSSFVGREVSERIVNRIGAFHSSSTVQEALRHCFDVALQDKADVCWQKFMRNLQTLAPSDVEKGIFPHMEGPLVTTRVT